MGVWGGFPSLRNSLTPIGDPNPKNLLFETFLSKDGVASENNFYNRIATCVLQDCSVNYTPTGVKSFEDGGPTQTTMKLSFKEIELLTKDKIGEGY